MYTETHTKLCMLQTVNVSNQTLYGRSVAVYWMSNIHNTLWDVLSVKIYYIGNDSRELFSFRMGFGKRN